MLAAPVSSVLTDSQLISSIGGPVRANFRKVRPKIEKSIQKWTQKSVNQKSELGGNGA